MNASAPLPDALHDALRSGTTTNPALNRLIDDDHVYHLVFLGLGGLAAIALAWAAACLIRRRRRLPAALLVACALLTALVWAGNLTTVLGPRHAVAEAASSLTVPRAGSRLARIDDAYARWITAAHGPMPPAVRHAIAERIAWQAPRTLICAVLLVLVGMLTYRIWSTRPARAHSASGSPVAGRGRRGRRIAAGLVALAACLVLGAMVIGNAESWAGPVFPTVLYG